jgi:hypothetical protein
MNKDDPYGKRCQYPNCPNPEKEITGERSTLPRTKYHEHCKQLAKRLADQLRDTRTYEQRREYFARYHLTIRKLK